MRKQIHQGRGTKKQKTKSKWQTRKEKPGKKSPKTLECTKKLVRTNEEQVKLIRADNQNRWFPTGFDCRRWQEVKLQTEEGMMVTK